MAAEITHPKACAFLILRVSGAGDGNVNFKKRIVPLRALKVSKWLIMNG